MKISCLWIVFLIVLMGCDFSIESGFIYFPSGQILSTPADAGLAYEEVFLTTRDGIRIAAWVVPFHEDAPTLLWFHGNAGNIGDRVGHLKIYHDRWKVNQMIVEYRGYGRSQGKVSEQGTYEDGRAAVRYLVDRIGVEPSKLFLFGRSLGSAVAVQMALDFPSAGLILESPFTSIRDMAKIHYPVLGHLFPLRIRYDSIGKISKINTPLLVLHGDRDRIVPIRLGQGLFEAAHEPKTFFAVRDAGHNDILSHADDRYHETVREFIKNCVQD